jgi:PKD repeat protein
MSHTPFPTAGTYNVSMVANDGCGFDTAYTTITVYPKPISVFTIDQDTICSGQSVQFTNQSQNVSSTLWFFGDGDSSILANPSHIYQLPGQYTVFLVVSAQNTNCSDTSSIIITVVHTPIAMFLSIPGDGCQPLLINFQNLTLNSTYHIWSFGDGNSSVDFEPNHLYTDAGQFLVTLIEIGDYGCADTASTLVHVFPKPEASFLVSQDSSCSYPITVGFTNTSMGALAYDWDLGNGQTSTNTNESSTYSVPGAYLIQLIASNQYGCTDTASYTFNVYQSPTAFFDFGPFQGCAPLTIQFDNLSLLGTNFYWDFGDGTFSNEQEPVHIYSTAGLFSPSLIVTGVGGCTDTLESQSIVQVFPRPIASFTYETHNLAAPEATVNFQNYSQDADIYNWFFGDGSSTNETNPTHTYSENDSFLVTLISGNDHGCYDTSMQWINVDFQYGLYVPNALTPENGPSATRLFTPKGVGLKSYHIWIYDTWGNLLWDSDKISETGSPLESWNGYYNDELLPQDVYVWKIEAVFRNGVVWKGKEYQNGRIKNTGTVTLLR